MSVNAELSVILSLVRKAVLFTKLKSIVGSENVTDKEMVMEAYTASTFRPQARGSLVVYTDMEKPKKPPSAYTTWMRNSAS